MLRKSLLIAFLGSISQIVFAQDDKKFALSAKDIEITQQRKTSVFDFDVVTASRLEESAGKAPANVRVITEEQIRERGYRSLTDVLRDMNGFKIDEYATEDWLHEVTFNGVRGLDKVIILLDGIRISSPTNNSMLLVENYPVHFVKQIEVVYGPASALYGADAVTGVINIITKSGNKNFNAEVSSAVGTHGQFNQQFWLQKKFGKDQSLMLAGQYFDDAQPDMSQYYPQLYKMEGHQTGTFNTIFGKFTPKKPVTPRYEAPVKAYAITGKLQLKDFQLGFFHNYGASSSSTSVNPQNSVYNKEQIYGHSITTGYGVFQKHYDKISLISMLQGSWYEIDPKTNYRNQYVNMEAGYKYGYGFMFKIEQQIVYQALDKLNFMAGITHERFTAIPKTADLAEPVDKTKDITTNKYLGTELPMKFFNLAYSNTGGFFQTQYSPKEWLHLTAGFRTDYNTRFGGTFNPRVGLVIQPDRTFTIKALYGSAFFAPPPNNAFAHFGAFFSENGGNTYKANFLQVPNPELQPIVSRKIELHINKIIKDNLSLSLDLFYLDLEGLFVDVSDREYKNFYDGKYLGWNVGYLQVTTNNGKQQNWGGSLLLDYQKTFGNLKVGFYGSVDYVDGTVDSPQVSGLQIPLITNWLGKAGLTLGYKGISLSNRLIASGEQILASFEKIDDDKTKDNTRERQKIAGYYMINTTLRYDRARWGIFCDIRNTFDLRNYHAAREASKYQGYQFYGIPQMPMRASVGVQVKW